MTCVKTSLDPVKHGYFIEHLEYGQRKIDEGRETLIGKFFRKAVRGAVSISEDVMVATGYCEEAARGVESYYTAEEIAVAAKALRELKQNSADAKPLDCHCHSAPMDTPPVPDNTERAR